MNHAASDNYTSGSGNFILPETILPGPRAVTWRFASLVAIGDEG
jgi:hypothetical protein